MTTITISPAVATLINRSEGAGLKYADAAREASGEDSFLRKADKAMIALEKVPFEPLDGKRSGADANRPQLALPQPRIQREGEDPRARYSRLLNEVMATLAEAGLAKLDTLLANRKVIAQSQSNGQAALLREYEAALNELEAATESARQSEGRVQGAQEALAKAQAELEAAQRRLDGLAPDSPDYRQALADRDAAQAKAGRAQQAFDEASRQHRSALDSAQAANVKAEGVRQKVVAEGIPTSDSSRDDAKRNLASAAQLALLMAMFAKLLGDSADERLEMERKLAGEIRDAQAAQAVAEAKKQQEEIAKAERASKAMGCIGKVLGAVLTVVSVVGAVFTGGASLAIAAVGIALMAGDMIGKAITGTSFMEAALKPLMTHVLSPMVQAIGKAMGDALKALGVNASLAETVGHVIGAVAAAAAMIAAMVVVATVAKGAASRIAPKMAEMIGKLASKAVPDLLKQAGRSSSRLMSQMMNKVRGSLGMKSDPTSLARYGNYVQSTAAGVQGVGTGTQSGLQVSAGIHQKNAAEHMAAVVIASAIVESMANWLSEAVERFGDALSKQNRMIEQMSGELQNHLNTGLQIARRV